MGKKRLAAAAANNNDINSKGRRARQQRRPLDGGGSRALWQRAVGAIDAHVVGLGFAVKSRGKRQADMSWARERRRDDHQGKGAPEERTL